MRIDLMDIEDVYDIYHEDEDYEDDYYGECTICLHELDENGFCENCLGEGLRG